MEYKRSFQDKLKDTTLKTIMRTLIFVLITFSITIVSVQFINYEIESRTELKKVKQVFSSLYQQNVNFLNESEALIHDLEDLESNNYANFTNAINRFNQGNKLRSQAIILDDKWQVRFSSEPFKDDAYLNYIQAVLKQMVVISSTDIYQTFYKPFDDYSDIILIKPIERENKVQGFILMLISGSNWSYYSLSEFKHSNIITDKHNNVIFYDRPNIAPNRYVFEHSGLFKETKLNNNTYWITHETLSDVNNFNIYSLVYSNTNSSLFIVFLITLLIGILWYRTTKKFTNQLAKESAISVNRLVEDIHIIRNNDFEHRIHLDSEDEFQYISNQINTMLDNIASLNKRNTNLLKLNNTIEMTYLTAQFNPHFLYNTLETIRNHIFFDSNEAERLILKLTKVLKYSVDNSNRDVPLKKDMEYINSYIDVQKARFGDRLTVEFDIDPLCDTCLVPKLLLQPIIENSIQYGFSVKRNIDILITGKVINNALMLTIKDNALGMEDYLAHELNKKLKKATNETSSNGLYNIARRLQIQYSLKSGIEIQNETGKGLTVIIRVDQTF